MPEYTGSGSESSWLFFFCSGLYVWLTLRLKDVNDRALFGACVLFAVGVPFLLPHMHDRYFFMADVLTLVLAVVWPQLAPVPVCVSFGSLLGYHAYLKMRYLMPMKYGAMAMLLALALTLAYTALSLDRHASPEEAPAPPPAQT